MEINFQSPAICLYHILYDLQNREARKSKKVPQGIGAHTCAVTSPTLQWWGMRRAPYVHTVLKITNLSIAWILREIECFDLAA